MGGARNPSSERTGVPWVMDQGLKQQLQSSTSLRERSKWQGVWGHLSSSQVPQPKDSESPCNRNQTLGELPLQPSHSPILTAKAPRNPGTHAHTPRHRLASRWPVLRQVQLGQVSPQVGNFRGQLSDLVGLGRELLRSDDRKP